MKTKELTVSELDARLTDARRQLTEKREAQLAAEAAADTAALEGRLDDLALTRLGKNLSAARETVRRWEEQVERLTHAVDAAAKVRQEGYERQRVAEAEALCRRRVEIAARLEAWCKEGAELSEQFVTASIGALEKLPHRPQNIPSMFAADGLRIRLQLCLLAACPTVWAAARGMSAWEAQRLPGLKATVDTERVRLLSEFPQPVDGPEAA